MRVRVSEHGNGRWVAAVETENGTPVIPGSLYRWWNLFEPESSREFRSRRRAVRWARKTLAREQRYLRARERGGIEVGVFYVEEA